MANKNEQDCDILLIFASHSAERTSLYKRSLFGSHDFQSRETVTFLSSLTSRVVHGVSCWLVAIIA